jgi:hypothetical protein
LGGGHQGVPGVVGGGGLGGWQQRLEALGYSSFDSFVDELTWLRGLVVELHQDDVWGFVKSFVNFVSEVLHIGETHKLDMLLLRYEGGKLLRIFHIPMDIFIFDLWNALENAPRTQSIVTFWAV